jgi:hypothetical protein
MFLNLGFIRMLETGAIVMTFVHMPLATCFKQDRIFMKKIYHGQKVMIFGLDEQVQLS